MAIELIRKNLVVTTANLQIGVNRPNIYLTFDDGPNAGTGGVLDVLKAEGVSAAFFMNSNKLAANPEPHYRLVRRMIDEGHVLADHGHDHDPMTSPGYRRTTTIEVRKDFQTSRNTFERIFNDRKDTFPGFVAARLPGDGRTFPEYVKMITDEVRLPHVSWDSEFAPNGQFNGRPDLHRNWISGVAATIAANIWPRAEDIVLLHDAHWSGKKNLFMQLIQKLKEQRMLGSLRPLPSDHKQIRMPGTTKAR